MEHKLTNDDDSYLILPNPMFNNIKHRKFIKLVLLTGQHAAHIFNLLVIPNKLYKICNFLISFLLG